MKCQDCDSTDGFETETQTPIIGQALAVTYCKSCYEVQYITPA